MSMISQKLISANANTVLRCASYSKKSKVFAFGAANLIHLYSPIHYKTFLTLNHHSDRVNTLKFFDNDELLELISCGADGKILHWVNVNKEKDPFDVNGWKMEKEYKSSDKGKNVSINLLDVLYINRFEKYIATFTSNGILDLFYFDVDLDEFKLFASMNYAKKLQDAICLTVLDDDHPIPANLPQSGLQFADSFRISHPGSIVMPEQKLPAVQNTLPKVGIKPGEHDVVCPDASGIQLFQKPAFLHGVFTEKMKLRINILKTTTM